MVYHLLLLKCKRIWYYTYKILEVFIGSLRRILPNCRNTTFFPCKSAILLFHKVARILIFNFFLKKARGSSFSKFLLQSILHHVMQLGCTFSPGFFTEDFHRWVWRFSPCTSNAEALNSFFSSKAKKEQAFLLSIHRCVYYINPSLRGKHQCGFLAPQSMGRSCPQLKFTSMNRA